MLVRGGSVRLGRARQDAGFFSRLRDSTEAQIGYSACADAFSAAFLPWAASAVDGRKNSARTRLPGLFSLECPSGAALLPEACHEEG